MTTEELAKLAQEKLTHKTGALADFSSTMLTLFKQNGLKLQNPEAYKFTSLKTFVNELSLSNTGKAPLNLDLYKNETFINLVFVDGQLLSGIPKVSGLTITSINDSFNSIASLFKTDNPFSELHHALLDQGIVIEVASKVKIDKPIRIVNLVSTSGLNATTVVIKVAAFAEISIVEENHNQNHSELTLGETFLMLETGAQVEHVQLSKSGQTALTHAHTQAWVGKDANYRNVQLNLSGKLNRANLSIDLTAAGGNGESYALYLTNDTEHSDINTVIKHAAPDTTSNQIAKGILDGESKGIFTGKIHIHPHAQRVASGQLNKNLILSKKAQAHSQPQLEIFADDVKCSHGSTTGQLSDDEVFYFEARGIPADKAKTLLALGFGLEIVQKIHHKTLRSHIEGLVRESLKTKFQLGSNL